MTQEEISALNYVNEDPDNVVFYFNGRVFCYSNRKSIYNHILTDGGNIKFACRRIVSQLNMQRSNIKMDMPYVMMRSLGCLVGLVPLFEMNEVVANENIHYIEIVETNINIITTASLHVLQGMGVSLVGASHCQEGQNDRLYFLKIIQPPPLNVGGKTKSKRKYKSTRKYKSKRKFKSTRS